MFEFMWQVPTNGFQWVEAEWWFPSSPPLPAADWFLTRCAGGSGGFYHPLTDEPALFLTFADVAPTEAAVLDFANRYGQLGVLDDIRLPNGRPSYGERLDRWVTELRSLKATIQVWEALTEERYEDLARWMSWRPGPMDELEEWDRIIHYTPDHVVDVVDIPPAVRIPAMVPGLWVWSAGDTGVPSGDPTTRDISTTPADLACAYIRELVNVRLRDYTSTRLLDRQATPGALPIGLSVVPTNLLGAIWLQCARAIEGVGRYQRCPQCRKWFAVPPKAMRDSTSYCTTRCRVAAFRARRREESRSLV
jgi:hypothetical protein